MILINSAIMTNPGLSFEVGLADSRIINGYIYSITGDNLTVYLWKIFSPVMLCEKFRDKYSYFFKFTSGESTGSGCIMAPPIHY
jgi:hypothetical protein